MGLPGDSQGGGVLVGESLETRRWNLSMTELELEAVFCSRRVELERRGELVLSESSEELLSVRSALVKTRGALDSIGS